MPAASVLIMPAVVVGPALKLTPPTVLSVAIACPDAAPDADIKSDLINPVVPLCLTLDHPSDCCSRTSTLVFAASVLIMLALVDELALKLTEPMVLSVAGAPDEPPDAPDSDSKSDLIKPSVPLCLTLDHPFDSFASISTLVFAASVLTILDVVDEPDLKLTEPVVLRVPTA